MIEACVVYDMGPLSDPKTKKEGIFYIPKRNSLETFSLSHKHSLGHNSGSFYRLQAVAEIIYSKTGELKYLWYSELLMVYGT